MAFRRRGARPLPSQLLRIAHVLHHGYRRCLHPGAWCRQAKCDDLGAVCEAYDHAGVARRSCELHGTKMSTSVPGLDGSWGYLAGNFNAGNTQVTKGNGDARFGVTCHVKDPPPHLIVRTVWFGPGSDGIASVKTWAQSDSFCSAKGLRLATYDQYCPNGKVVGGAKGQYLTLSFTTHSSSRTQLDLHIMPHISEFVLHGTKLHHDNQHAVDRSSSLWSSQATIMDLTQGGATTVGFF